MAKTEQELIKMSFMALKRHCKTLDIAVGLGVTKGSMIKAILIKDPPPIESQQVPLTKEAKIKQQLSGNSAEEDTKESVPCNDKQSRARTLSKTMNGLIKYDEAAYKDNGISEKEALRIIKRYCPKPLGMSTYNAFTSMFKSDRCKDLTVNEFIAALLTANDDILGKSFLEELFTQINAWNDVTNNNGYDLAVQHLNGFHAPPQSSQATKLMFSLFAIPNIIPKLEVIQKIHEIRQNLLALLVFMETFNESIKEVLSNDVYSKIFLSSILLNKFRNEDTQFKGYETFKNVVDFLQKLAVEPTAKELFQSKRWNTLQKKGKLIDEINRPQFTLSDQDFNQIRSKAIQFGSALQPQMPRILHSERDKEAKKQEIKNEIGSIDTKALQNKLANALIMRQSAGNTKAKPTDNDDNDDEEEKKVVGGDDDDIDLSKYDKMLSIGVKLDAVTHEMKVNGVDDEVIDEFVNRVNNTKDESSSIRSKPSVNAPPPRLPNALMADINANPAPLRAAAAPAPPPVPAPFPAPGGGGHAALPHGASNGMVSSSILPTEHSNAGLRWDKAKRRYKQNVDKVKRVKVLVHTLDIRLYQQQQRAENKDNDNDEDEVDEEKIDLQRNAFYDDTFKIYMAQIYRIEKGLKTWITKSNENENMMKELEIAYHSKFRPMIFKELTATQYNALSEAANNYDEAMVVPDDVVGVIWMFVKPFDELVELKFAVDTINKFFDKDKKKVAVKKLPIQSHRGYEQHYLL